MTKSDRDWKQDEHKEYLGWTPHYSKRKDPDLRFFAQDKVLMFFISFVDGVF